MEVNYVLVNNWQEYLMFAYLFGNAKKVMKQFKNLYPEIIDDMNSYNISNNSIAKISHLSHMTYNIARNSYSKRQMLVGGSSFSDSGGYGGSR